MNYYVKNSIQEYVERRRPPGSFVLKVLENNLQGAFAYADDECRADLHEIVKYVYNEIPGNCWGSPEKVKNWLRGDS